MERSVALKMLQDVLFVYVGCADITESTDLQGLGLDSLDLVQVAVLLEEQYDIEITFPVLKALVTMKDVVDILEKINV